MKRLLLVLVLSGTLVPGLTHANSPETPLPVDSRVLKGELDNGLAYLIRENGRPEARAELRLVVKAGSVDEDDDQRGLAHFTEHMLFNGTERYQGNDIIDYLESIGARFGADLNAYTSFDETVYMLEIPTDRSDLLPEGIRILADFAVRATLSAEEIEKERGVVLDEWRRGLGASSRIRDEQLPVLLKGSRYAERLPIGLPEIIEGAPPEVVRRYYRDWYRPERMAVIAVGDFDARKVLETIRVSFGPFPATENLRERVDWPVPVHADTLFALADDAELRATTIGWSTKREPEEGGDTYGGYHRDLVSRMALRMLNDRLDELARSENPPYLAARFSTQRIGRTIELTGATARVTEGGEAKGLAALLTEVRRAELHGFTDSEVERARRRLLAGIEAGYAEREKTPSAAYVSEYTRHFLNDEPIPGIALERDLWHSALPAVDADDCHEAFLHLLAGGGLVVEAARPTRPEMVGEDELLAVLRGAGSVEIAPYEDAASEIELVAHRPPGGEVVERKEIPEIGVTEVLLSNGIRVFLKPTTFQDDDVRFVGNAFGGTSVVPEEALASASFAGAIVAESGWGGHAITDLRKILAGKVAQARPVFEGRSHGVSGSSTVEDLPTALDLAVLVMTAPNEDAVAFDRFRERLRANLANRAADPGAKYSDRVVEINTSGHPRARPMDLSRVDEIDHRKALDFYRRCFANAADFTFVFVGNLDVEAVIPLIARTLGSLPTKGEPTGEWIDHEIDFPAGTTKEVVRAGREPKGLTTITLPSYEGSDPREWHRLRTAASILSRRLRESLREDLGATYGVSVQYRHALVGPARGKISIGFGCDPAEAEALGGRVFETLAELSEGGVSEEELEKEQEIQTRDLQTNLERNGFWMGSLASLWIRGRMLTEVQNRQARIDELDAESLDRVFRQHFASNRYTWVTMEPEENAVSTGS